MISELVTNSVLHANLSREDRIEVRASFVPEAVRIEVADPGPGFQPTRPPPPGDGSKWGLYLLDRLADRWGVEGNGGSRTWFEIDLG